MIKSILYIAFFAMFVVNTIAQENILLNRKFWKGQPSIDSVKIKIAEGHSPTEMNDHNFDPTGYAILEKASLDMIKYLLAQGNDVNKLTHDARTYIFWAAYKGNLELMEYLTEKGADPSLIDQHGYSLLMFTAATGQEDKKIYEYIISLGGDVNNDTDRKGRNVLLAYAASMETGELIEYFISKGLDVHSVDKKGNGIFHHVALTGNQALAEHLINTYEVKTSKNNETNENAILFASERFSRRGGKETDISFYEYLEGLGLDPVITSNSGKTALQNLARRSNNIELIKYFIDKGSDVNQADEEGNNALLNAASGKSTEILSLLLTHTSDVNHVNKEGLNCFMKALRNNKLEVMELLVSEGANTNITDKKGFNTGYHLIDAFRGDMEVFKTKMDFLINHGYQPDVLQGDGTSLLHAAVDKNNVDLIKYLLDVGLDINTNDQDGQTILHQAAMQAKDAHLLKYLVDAGADKSKKTMFEESAYDLASANELLNENSTDLNFLRTEGK